jgi:hypothetical protein
MSLTVTNNDPIVNDDIKNKILMVVRITPALLAGKAL